MGAYVTFTIADSDRQLVLLALALMSLQRPGFLHAARLVAEQLQGSGMFEDFRTANYPDPLEAAVDQATDKLNKMVKP